MITLYSFGPLFGLPDPSPFCMKAQMLLKIAGLEYQVDKGGFDKAPKGKQPYMDDDGETTADSTFIRFHIEKKYDFDFNSGLDDYTAGVAWAVEKMCDDHLYWVLISERWCNLENFNRGPRVFFDAAPALIRPFIASMIRKKVIKATKAHGLGRHSVAEIHLLAGKAIDAMADIMGDNKYMMGNSVSGADATAFAFIDALSCKHFESPVIAMIEKHQNLIDYRNRMRAEWYPEFYSSLES